MARFVRHSARKVQLVSSDRLDGPNVVEVPDGLSHLSSKELMISCHIRGKEIVETKAVYREKKLRVAWVSVHNIKCGIATYSGWLTDAMRPLVDELHTFAEHHPDAVDSENVTHCWKRGKPLGELVAALRDYEPDVIYVQHEFGIFPNARYWLSFMSALHAYRVVVTMHSVYAHRDKTIVEAAIPEIIVHNPRAQHELKEVKKVPGKVSVVPHGTFQPHHGRLWNLLNTKHSLVMFGFGFRYKAYENVFHAVAELKGTYPDIFFTAIFSESAQGKAEMDPYFADLQEIIEDLNLHDHVALIRGFQSDESLDSYLRTHRVAVFPYKDNGEHTVFGSSGAALLAMSKGMPVITSPVPLFDGIGDVVPRPGTCEDLAKAISDLFDDGRLAEQLRRQDKFLRDNSWDNVARHYLDVLR